tara:strand:+ start:8585 stop:9214 length:630 start_codon:yes stop_codon:yes gene_type:complete
MTVKDALNAVKVMLGQDTPKVEAINTNLEEAAVENVVDTKLEEAELSDGTIVYTDGALEVGATLFVQTDAEEEVTAPEGKHSTKDGAIITVGQAGEILAIETEEEEPVEEVVEEEVIEEELAKAKEETTTEVFNAEEFVSQIAELIAPYQAEIKDLKANLEVLTERFEAVADLPASKPLKKSFMAEAKAAKIAEDSRVALLSKMRRNVK